MPSSAKLDACYHLMYVEAQHSACLWSVLYYLATSGERTPIGIILLDSVADRLYSRMRSDWEPIEADSAFWWTEFRNQMAAEPEEAGGSALFQMLQESASNTLTVSDAQELYCADIATCLRTLYLIHVDRRL